MKHRSTPYNSAAGYQNAGPVQGAAVSANAAQARDLANGPLAQAVGHLNAQTERGEHAPKLPYDPVENPAA